MIFPLVGRIVASGMLIWALDDHPYGYFTLLRFIVCVVAAYCTYAAYSQKNEQWTWTFGAIAVLFNPIIPFHLNRQIWSIIDVISAIVLLISIFFVKGEKPKTPE